MTGLLLVALFLGLLALRQNLLTILLVLCAMIHVIYGDGDLLYIVEDFWSAVDREALMSIPLFLLCGIIMSSGGIADRLIGVLKALTVSIPGGLGAATVLSCAVFAAISGSSTVTLLAVGAVMYPTLLANGYTKRYSLGAISSAGTLGILIPPSIPLIVYGIVTETSITDMFVAGVIPGIILTLLFALHAIYTNRHLTPELFDATELIAACRRGVWSLLLPVILLGGIYAGYFTATESAAVALTYAIFVETFIHKELNARGFVRMVAYATQLLGGLLPILAIASSLNLLLTAERIPTDFAAWIASMVDHKWMFLLMLNLVLIGLGCLMDMISAIIIVAPIILPVALSYGIDPVHLGIIMIINLEIGLLTPPVGINIVVATQAFRANFLFVCKAVLPFIALMAIMLALVSFFPWFSMALVR